MMLDFRHEDRADRVAAMVRVVARERADREHPSEWTDYRSYSDMVYLLRSIEAWTEGPKWDRTVVVEPRMRPTNDCWAHVASEILDTAVDRVENDRYTLEHGEFRQRDGSYLVRLAWTHKPNLDRLYDDGPGPLLGFTYAGREHYLSGRCVELPVLVASSYTLRHSTAGDYYGRHLRHLAWLLDVPVEDARRIADILVPGRQVLDAERNTAIRILSPNEENAVVAARSRANWARACGAHS